MWLYFHCGPFELTETHTIQGLSLIRSHVNIMTTVTVIIISLITIIKNIETA